MLKFVYNLTPTSGDLYIKASDLKTAQSQLKESFGRVHSVRQTAFRSVRKTVEQHQFELNLLN